MNGWVVFIIVVLMYVFLLRFVRGSDERVSDKKEGAERKRNRESR